MGKTRRPVLVLGLIVGFISLLVLIRLFNSFRPRLLKIPTIAPLADGRFTKHRNYDSPIIVPLPTVAPIRLNSTIDPNLPPVPNLYSNYSYCQAEYPQSTGYEAVKGAKLKLVQIVVRHGDRTPVHSTLDTFAEWDCSSRPEISKLEDRARLGDGNKDEDKHYADSNESPSIVHRVSIPEKGGYSWAIPTKGNCVRGQLTMKGMWQHRELGKHLRDIYVDKLNYLPKVLDHTEDVYVRHTYIWRTKQSAMSLIEGMFPNATYNNKQPFEFVQYPQEIETMFSNPGACPKLKVTFGQMQQSVPYKRYIKSQAALHDELIDILGSPFGSGDWMNSMEGWMDILNTHSCHNKQLPCSSQNKTQCATTEIVKQLNLAGSFEYAWTKRDDPFAPTYNRLGSGPFVSELKRRWEQVNGETEPASRGPKFEVYSAHDDTVSYLLGTLQAYDMRWPPYASNLIFELWERDQPVESGKDSYVFRVIYNGQVLRVPWADLNEVSYDDFVRYLQPYIAAPEELRNECGVVPEGVA
ncbi:phosphoglycerate mutase-like protein [Ramicandelaber brevisporus]|nr:phosphoglycerate mutase-like protein [Ramicandelaber brevisporus]